MTDSGEEGTEAFPESASLPGEPFFETGRPDGGSKKENEAGCPGGSKPGPREIESVLQSLDRTFIRECIKRLEPQEKEGKPHE